MAYPPYYLPTYQECLEICEAHENFLFFESKQQAVGFNISIFGYRLAHASNFDKPIPGKPWLKAYELRGITFVFNTDGSVYRRFLMMEKFWNLGQTESSLYSKVQNLEIEEVFNKEDGSLASFIELPNGKILGRSKLSLYSEQALQVQKIYNRWPALQQFVDYCLANDLMPYFEYVAPNNRIVLNYAEPDLVLLKIRKNQTGEYLPLVSLGEKLKGVTVVKTFQYRLEQLLEMKDYLEDLEGWVLQFKNGMMVKIKTEWYNRLHFLFTTKLEQENSIIDMILEEKIDDILSQLTEISAKRMEVDAIQNIVNREMVNLIHQIDEMKAHYSGDRKAFAITYSKTPIFPLAISAIDGRDKIDLAKNYIKKNTQNLMQAREWLGKRGWVKPDYIGYKEE